MILRVANILISLAIALTSISGVCVNAESEASTVVRIEQDWKVELYSTKGDANSSPQLISAFRLPNSTNAFQITWNHIDSPSYSPGGFQLQAWGGGVLVGSYTAWKIPLSAANEVLTWTQVVTTTTSSQQATEYALQVENVSSSSWGGNVTGDQVFKLSFDEVANLNDYTAAACLENSAITVGTNRVKWYGIVETRFYDQEGRLISRDTAAKTVFQQEQSFTYYKLKKLDWIGTVSIDSKTGGVTLAPSDTDLMILSQ